MKNVLKALIIGVFVLALNTTCFASALTDFQAAQAQVAALTVQVQQAAVLAQADQSQLQNYQLLQAQQTMQALQPAAAQELQQQQAAAIQAQQTAAIVPQQPTTNETIVYIAATGDGTKYHHSGCRTIKHGEVALPLSQAQAMGRTPCGICYR